MGVFTFLKKGASIGKAGIDAGVKALEPKQPKKIERQHNFLTETPEEYGKRIEGYKRRGY